MHHMNGRQADLHEEILEIQICGLEAIFRMGGPAGFLGDFAVPG